MLRGVVALVALLGTLALPGVAAAHVTVEGTATQGGFGRVTVRVPNESDTASTVKVELVLPTSPVIPFVSVMPVPGWTAATELTKLPAPVRSEAGEITEAITKITWTAAPGGGIGPEQFMEFGVSLGPLPKVDQLVFKALQTYSDGKISRWIEEPVAGQPEPESPAPVLKLQAAAAPTTAAITPSADGGADWVSIVALVAGLGGLVLGALALLVARSRAPRVN